MPWVRLDDHFDEHPKLSRVGPLGLALFVTGLAYCNRNLTDGFIPWARARTMMSWEFLGADDGGERGQRLYSIGVSCGMAGEDVTGDFVIGLLLDAGLWDEVPGGYRVHDYDDYQPTKAQVEAEREKKAEAGRAGGLASAQARAQAGASSNVEQDASTRSSKTQAKSKPVPDPVPVPLLGEEEGSEAIAISPHPDAEDSDFGSRETPRRRGPRVVREVYSADFEDGWSYYPRKTGKHAAWLKWQALVRNGETVDRLIAACRHFAAEGKRDGREMQFTMQGERFFGHAKHYLDYVERVPDAAPRSNGKAQARYESGVGQVIRLGGLEDSA
jgi:hypothetical protein